MKRILMNKCECCGALFEDNTCDHCGARYTFEEDYKPMRRVVNNNDNNITDEYIIMNVYGKKYKFYVGNLECKPLTAYSTYNFIDGDRHYVKTSSSPQFRIELISCGEYYDEDNA